MGCIGAPQSTVIVNRFFSMVAMSALGQKQTF
jgi:hypothetical protein